MSSSPDGKGVVMAAARSVAARSGAEPELLRTTTVTDPLGIRAVGQVDLTVWMQWESALAGLADVGSDIHIDLSGLTFIDVRGTVALVEVSRRLRRKQRMRLYDPPDGLVRILNAMWPGGLPTITIEAS